LFTMESLILAQDER